MLVIVVARRPEATKRGHGRDAGAVAFQNAADLADGAGIVVEMLERLAGRDAVECAGAKREPRQIAENDGNVRIAANVQHRVEGGVDAEDAKALLLQPPRELTEAGGCIENARTERKLFSLPHDDREGM